MPQKLPESMIWLTPTRHVMSVELKLYRSVALTLGTSVSKHQEINLAQLIARGNKKNEETISFKMFKRQVNLRFFHILMSF